MVRFDTIELIYALLKTHQVVLLIDYNNPDLSKWIATVLLDHLKLHVDAIYSYNESYSPSRFLIDVTQIVDDFRLLGEY